MKETSKITDIIDKSHLMSFKGSKLFSCLTFMLITISTLQAQSCEDQVTQINNRIQEIIINSENTNAIYDTYSVADSCIWATNNWTGDIDFSGIAFDDNRAGTLISPRHILMATHYQRAVGSILSFHDSVGGIHNASLISKASLPGGTNPDITVGLLDVEVPVTYYKVLPPQNNWGSCLNGALAISTHHPRNASIREVSSASGSYINFRQSSAVPVSYYAPAVGGNSGNPTFLIINNDPILISTFTFGGTGTGPFFSSPTNFEGIDSLMTLLGGGYHLETNGIDEDGDGFYDYEDCDDNNPDINPDQTEIQFNGLDDDCNPSTLDHDEDGDGFSIEEDCNDQDPNINPAAQEILNNNIDEDCDGMIDEYDVDNDGFLFEEDCDDNNPYINPNAPEIPNNEIDENCDGELLQIEACETASTGPFSTFINASANCETPFAATFEVWTNESYSLSNLDIEKTYYFDFCEGYNQDVWEALITVMASNLSSNELGYIITAKADCRIEFQFSYQEEFPDVVVIISNRNNCTGSTESINNGVPTFGCLIGPLDEDEDGFTADIDCDDTNPLINPEATEVLYNGIDDDCNPNTLDDDLDQDGFILADDCDDNNTNINPNQIEEPYNGIDDDCDSSTLDDDLDQDGFTLADDCDDNNTDINPNQTEEPYNGIDDDCDSSTFDDDLDQDGFTLADDCDDNNTDINPNQTEEPYNGIDDDCDSSTLDDDLDQDGFILADDCDDNNADINPNAVEIPNNGIDEDCDGTDLLSSTYDIGNSTLNIYPNPASDVIYIKTNGLLIFQANLYDLYGQLISTHRNTNLIEVRSIPTGTYLIKIQFSNSTHQIVERIVIGR